MNTSQFMDKQIMDLSNSQSNNDFIDLINHPQEDHNGGGAKKEEILPNYDFQPIRPVGGSQLSNFDSSNDGGTRVWTSSESKTNSGIRNYGSLDSMEPAKVIVEKDRNVYDAALISEIDRTMKKHADNLLHALEGLSARLSQLESRSRHLENSVDDLKVSVGNNHGHTDGKMRQIENIIREVQAGVQDVSDKQEILEAQLQLSKVQVSKLEQQSETQNTGHMDSMQKGASAPMQSHHQLPPVALTQPLPTLPPPNAPPPQNHLPPPSVQLLHQFSQNISSVPHRNSYFPPPGQTPEVPNQQYQLPPAGQTPEAPHQPYQLPPPPQQLQPPPPAPPPPQYQPPPHPQYSQPPPPPQQHPSQPQPPVGHHPEETPYIPSQIYPPSIRQPSGALPTQQFYGTPPHMYEPPSSRPGSELSAPYGPPPSGHSEQYPYGGPPSQYGGGSSPVKSQQHFSPAVGPSGGSGYPQLPTARILPQALPTAAGVGGGSGGSGGSTGNRVPIDDVVDKVTNMGFPRDQVRATVRKLTENGQSVDLNVVLDKLMNDGVEGQPPRGWFGR